VPNPDTIGGELQTLITTLQNTNTQLGQIYRVLTHINTGVGGPPVALVQAFTQAIAIATPQPEGYHTIDVPGVGPRRVPYYPVQQ
jgi:hypothetical protein